MSQSEGPLSTIGVVIPALNEEATIADQVAEVLAVAGRPDLPARIERVIVVDNGSTDRTAQRAEAAGAMVVSEPRRGYGRACFTGVLAAGDVDLIVQMDGDRATAKTWRFGRSVVSYPPAGAGLHAKFKLKSIHRRGSQREELSSNSDFLPGLRGLSGEYSTATPPSSSARRF